jgi:hypothetical protein
VSEGEAAVSQGSRGPITHKALANLQMNQSDMKEEVKTVILQHDHVLLNLTSIILSMAKNHDSLNSFSAQCLTVEMLLVHVKTKGEDGNVTRDPPCEPRGNVQNEG